MNAKKYCGVALVLFSSLFVFESAEAAGCVHHLGVGAGLVHQEEPSKTSFTLGAEYECRTNAFLGIGAFGSHVFSDPSFTLIGLPQLLIHPLGGDFYVAASPIMMFGDAYGTHFGARLSTRLPLPLGLFILVPSFAVDFIRGQRNYWFGLGLSF